MRAVSALLAALMAVAEFGRHLLNIVGAPARKSAKIHCYTEVPFPKEQATKAQRPDGMNIVSRGRTKWAAIIEAKIGPSKLTQEQIERYLDLARGYGIDALITISNQFVPDPNAAPVKIHGHKLLSVSLYHWSWTSILSEAILFADHKGIEDPDQAFILNELIRYLQHESSGVRPFTQMPPDWRELCEAANVGRRLAKGSDEVVNSAAGWIQLCRYIALQLTIAVGEAEPLYMSRAQRKQPSALIDEAIETLTSGHRLGLGFEVPHAAGTLRLEADLRARTLVASMSINSRKKMPSAAIRLEADLRARTLVASMSINSPGDKKMPSAAITFLMRQLDKVEDRELLIDVHWPRRSIVTRRRLAEIDEDRNSVMSEYPGLMPSGFTINRIMKVGAGITSVKRIVNVSCDLVTGYYSDVGDVPISVEIRGAGIAG